MRASHAVQTRRSRLLVVPPRLISGTWEWPLTVFLGLAVVAVFVVEALTPDVVVSALVLLPVAAGMWLLSNPPAASIAGLASVGFAISLLLEATNRWTLGLILVAVLAMSFLVRLYAISLADQFVGHHQLAVLTPREFEVARLASQAYTAAEIGTRLHIGERTVETHLANTYAKLRINSRRELIRLAANHGSPGGKAISREIDP